MSSAPEVIVGVLIAITAFVLQELVGWGIGSILFRRRLMADIKSLVDNFRGWCPPSQLEAPGDETYSDVTVAPIWDYGYQNLGDVYAHSSSLTSDLFPRVIRLYSATGRFDEIRCAYNNAIIEMIRSNRKGPWVAVLNGQLMDMAQVVREIVREGGALLATMEETYRVESQMHDLISSNGKGSD